MSSMRLAVLGFVTLLGCSKHSGAKEPHYPAFGVTSSAFAAGGEIPALYTCEDKNLSPPLAWSGLPAGTKSVALIMDDPDAPRGTWVHWVVYGLPGDSSTLPEAGSAQLPAGAKSGQNDFGDAGYGGPCPPSGTHHYHVKIYALDSVLPELGAATKADLLAAMTGHILAQGQLIGTYHKQKS